LFFLNKDIHISDDLIEFLKSKKKLLSLVFNDVEEKMQLDFLKGYKEESTQTDIITTKEGDKTELPLKVTSEVSIQTDYLYFPTCEVKDKYYDEDSIDSLKYDKNYNISVKDDESEKKNIEPKIKPLVFLRALN